MKCQLYCQAEFNKLNSIPSIPFKGQSDTAKPPNIIRSYYGALSLDTLKDTPIWNFRKVDEGFYRGAQPGIDENRGGIINYAKLKSDLKYLRDKFNITVILNLRNPHDNNTDHIELEKLAIKELNEEAKLLNSENPARHIPEIKGLNVNMYAEGIVCAKQARQVMEYFQENSDKIIFAHCRGGNDRTGIVTAWRRIWKNGLEDGVRFRDIVHEMKNCGHNQEWYPKLISSLALCIRHMGRTSEFITIKNAQKKMGFLCEFYGKNHDDIKKIASGCI